MPRIVITEGQGKGDSQVIKPAGLTVGRLSTNDVCLPDEQVSRQHARFELRDGRCYLADLGSANGTKVNGEKVQVRALVSGDLVTVGRTVIRFEDEDTARLQLKEGVPLDAGMGTIIKPIAEITGMPVLPRDGAALEKFNRKLGTLYEVGKALLSTSGLDDLLNLIMDQVFKELPAQRGFLLLIDKETGGLTPKVIRTKEPGGEGGITISRTITDMVIKDRVSVLTADAAADSRFQSGASVFLYGIRSALCSPLWSDDEVIGVIYIDTLSDSYSFTEDDLDLLTAMANQAAIGIQKAVLAEKARVESELRARLARYHSPDVVEHILMDSAGGDDGTGVLAVSEKEVTVLFSDIKGFTSLSERMTPGQVAALLNEYFTRMTDIVFEFGGTLDKYIGDAIMALFGAPFTREDDAVRAVRAGLKMQKELAALMQGLDESERFSVRVGINTGVVVAGNIGSPRRMDYTVIGDAVNVAQRLESIAKPGQVLIGGTTYELVKDRFLLKEIGRQLVKGKNEKVVVYEVLG